MLKNYLKITFRNIFDNKSSSVTNIVGLALGIMVFFLIVQYITFERSYDSFNKNIDRIYRIRSDRIYSDKHDKSAGCPPALAPTLKKEFPEVLESARVRGTDVTYIDANKKISENLENAYYAENSFMKIFSFPLLRGSIESILEEPNTIIISNSISQKYFGNEDPINKIIMLDNEYGKQNYKITGVFQDIPQNSHIKFNILISYKSLIARNSRAAYYWGWNAFNTYILLASGANPKALEAKFSTMIEKYKDYDKSWRREYILQSLKDIHLYSNLRYEHEVNGDAGTVYFLSIIALFVLILAWINYINLSTCRALNRSKEVVIKKVLGSNRLQLITQFITESLILNILAFLLAIILCEIVSPYFNRLTGKPLSLWLLKDNWVLIASSIVCGAFISSIYPAIIISSFNPISILKKRFNRITTKIDLRKGLVIFQFTVSIILIAFTLIVYEQLSFMKNKNLGMNIDQILILKAPKLQNNYLSSYNIFKDAILTFPTIKKVSSSATIPGKDFSNASSGVRSLTSLPEKGTQGFYIDVDENYFDLFDIHIVAGKNFSRESQYNKEIILNEEAVKVYGFETPENAINKKMIFDGLGGIIVEIIGVTRNYHQKSLKSSLQPVIFNSINATDLNLTKYFSLKIVGNNIKHTINQIRNKWDEIFPDQPFEYYFLDDLFNSQYKADQQFGSVFGLFSILAIIVSCLGLFGLAADANMRRTKEIGIRKVIGASVFKLIIMLNLDFIKWVIISFIFAIPISLYAMNLWLQNFAYRTDITWWIFALSGLISMSVALFTVSWQTWRAAIVNPVKSLRSE